MFRALFMFFDGCSEKSSGNEFFVNYFFIVIIIIIIGDNKLPMLININYSCFFITLSLVIVIMVWLLKTLFAAYHDVNFLLFLFQRLQTSVVIINVPRRYAFPLQETERSDSDFTLSYNCNLLIDTD